jgi:hypothetical protein
MKNESETIDELLEGFTPEFWQELLERRRKAVKSPLLLASPGIDILPSLKNRIGKLKKDKYEIIQIPT